MKHLDPATDYRLTQAASDAQDSKEKYSLTFHDLLECGEGILVGNVILDAKVSVTVTKYGRNGIPEVDSLQVSQQVFLVQRGAFTQSLQDVRPLLLDFTDLTHANEALYEDFIKACERTALERAVATEIEKWTYEDTGE